MDYITPVELKGKLDSNVELTVLDIREAYELDICSIGGLHIPMGDIVDRVNEIKPSVPVIVLCRSGKRAEAVANYLASEAKLNDVSILEGGILKWIDTVDSSLESY